MKLWKVIQKNIIINLNFKTSLNKLHILLDNNEVGSTELKSIKMSKKNCNVTWHDGYNILYDLNTTKCNIIFGHIINMSPKLKT